MTLTKRRKERLTPELRAIGEALRLLRVQAHRKQHQLADSAGVTKAMLSAYETGKQVPSMPTLLAILRGLGADFCDLQKAMDALSGLQETTTGLEDPRTGQQDPENLEKRQREIGRAVLEIAANLGLQRL